MIIYFRYCLWIATLGVGRDVQGFWQLTAISLSVTVVQGRCWLAVFLVGSFHLEEMVIWCHVLSLRRREAVQCACARTQQRQLFDNFMGVSKMLAASYRDIGIARSIPVCLTAYFPTECTLRCVQEELNVSMFFFYVYRVLR